jgi:hypothetical protein
MEHPGPSVPISVDAIARIIGKESDSSRFSYFYETRLAMMAWLRPWRTAAR